MRIITSEATAELTVKRSRFIAFALIAQDASQAHDKLVAVKKQHDSATHVVHAFQVGPAGEVQGMSDDGEPAGTAARPLMDVIRGEELTCVLLAVVRYFGGTLLGTGGLVRAYGDSARAVLSRCKTEEYIPTSPFSFAADYATYQSAKLLFKEYAITNLSEDYGEQVTAQGSIATERKASFAQALKDISRGRILCT